MKKPRHPIVRIEASSLSRRRLSAGDLRCVSVSHMNERNVRRGGEVSLSEGRVVVDASTAFTWPESGVWLAILSFRPLQPLLVCWRGDGGDKRLLSTALVHHDIFA